jgi:hypothetical protein
MNADLVSDAIGKAEADAVGKTKALADRIDAKYGEANDAKSGFGLTYEFLNDINELNDAGLRIDSISVIAANLPRTLTAVDETEQRAAGAALAAQ